MQGFQQIQSTTAPGEQIVTKRTTADLIEELESEAQADRDKKNDGRSDRGTGI